MDKKQYKKEYDLKNKDKIKQSWRKYSLRVRYNITTEQYDTILKQQNNCCDVCGEHESKFKNSLCVDHNHSTGKIRGLLCNNCNSAFGKLKENTNIMYNLINYANKYNKG
tara:strand:+ start:156 stop:485 length:330 start_codon:yes stop_codon:yes gene_type:complete